MGHSGHGMRATSRPKRVARIFSPFARKRPFPPEILRPRGALKDGWWDMSLDDATNLIRETLLLAMIVSAPMLLIGLGVGVVVSLIQAVTQIQEQTLSFVPKITAMIAAAIILMPWISQRLIEYSAAMFLTGKLP